jgi:hypothetical protein
LFSKLKPLVIIASGPSLIPVDVARVEAADVDIMGINLAYTICKRLDYLYACDTSFWTTHYSEVKDLPCKKYRLEGSEKKWPGVELLENDGTIGLSHEYPKIRTGQNSGYQALNLAYLLGYKKLILLGYDMQPSAKGKIHWHDDHEKRNPPPSLLERWVQNFIELAPLLKYAGVDVVNATKRTALTCFEKVKLTDVL